MAIRFFSDKDRPVHLGPYPLERLARTSMLPDLDSLPAAPPPLLHRPDAPESIVNAMGEYQAMLDAIRVGLVNKARAECPSDPEERANHLKAFGYFSDASMIGIGPIQAECLLDEPIRNPDIDRLAEDLRTRQTTTARLRHRHDHGGPEGEHGSAAGRDGGPPLRHRFSLRVPARS